MPNPFVESRVKEKAQQGGGGDCLAYSLALRYRFTGSVSDMTLKCAKFIVGLNPLSPGPGVNRFIFYAPQLYR